MTIACLKGFGKMPFLRDKLTSFVNEGEGCLYIVSQYVWDMDLQSKFLKGLP